MPPPEFQHVRLTMVGDVALVEVLTRNLQGQEVARQFGSELSLVLDQDGARRILLDFRRAAYLSSSSFAALFRLLNRARATDRVVRFCGMSDSMLAEAEVVGLPKVVDIHKDQLSGLQAFATG